MLCGRARTLVALVVAASAVALPVTIEAAEGEILAVLSSELPVYRALADGFAQGAGGAGRLVLSDPEQAPRLADRLAGARAVLAVGAEAAKAVAAARPYAPVLVAFAPDGGVGADSRTTPVPVVVSPAQQVAIIKRSLPSVLEVPRQPRLGVLFDPAISGRWVAECEAAASTAGFSLVKVEVRQRTEVAAAARDLLGRNVQALWLVPDATVVTAESFRTLMQLSLVNKVPLVGFSESMAKAGTVLAIQPDYAAIGRGAGQAAKRLANGEAVALPSPEGQVFLNAKAAALLEIALPDEVKAKAAKVYE